MKYQGIEICLYRNGNGYSYELLVGENCIEVQETAFDSMGAAIRNASSFINLIKKMQ